MTLYEEICKIVREKKVKFWTFAGNTYEFTHFYDGHHYQVKMAYVGKYHDDYLTTTRIVRMSRHNFDYIVRKLMYQIIRNTTVRNPDQVKFNVYYAKIDGRFTQVHGLTGDFYGWKKV